MVGDDPRRCWLPCVEGSDATAAGAAAVAELLQASRSSCSRGKRRQREQGCHRGSSAGHSKQMQQKHMGELKLKVAAAITAAVEEVDYKAFPMDVQKCLQASKTRMLDWMEAATILRYHYRLEVFQMRCLHHFAAAAYTWLLPLRKANSLAHDALLHNVNLSMLCVDVIAATEGK